MFGFILFLFILFFIYISFYYFIFLQSPVTVHSLLQECDGPFKICMAEVEQNRMTCAQAKLIQIIPEVNQACEIQGFMKKKKKKNWLSLQTV